MDDLFNLIHDKIEKFRLFNSIIQFLNNLAVLSQNRYDDFENILICGKFYQYHAANLICQEFHNSH